MPPAILFLDQFGRFGGAQRVLQAILRARTSSWYEPIIALNGEGDFREWLKSSGYAVHNLAIGKYSSGRKSVGDSWRFFWRTLWSACQLVVLVFRRDVQLLYANAPRTFICAAIAGRITGRPVIWHLHNVLSPGIRLKVVASFSGWVRQIVVCSDAAAQPVLAARPKLANKIVIVHNPVPAWAGKAERSAAKEGIPSSHHNRNHLGVGILGRITPFKGQLQFAEAARLVLQEFEQVHFWIIGSPTAGDSADEAYFEEVQRDVRAARLGSWFSFVPHDHDVARCYDLLDIVVLASQGPEAFPMILLEAMSLGKAIVAPRAGGVAELLEDGQTALLVREASAGSLAQGILDLLYDPGKRRQLAENGRKVSSERFSIDLFNEKIQRVLEAALR